MSIIIRLQNLPLNAKSADIRNFFGGLRIPTGGVHILGGEKGDAFIVFNSDEDARLAIRKDGGKVKDSRVRLFLSSHMEMQYEVEKITKTNNAISPEKILGQERMSPDEISRHRSPQRRYSRGRSPHRYNEWSNDRHRNVSEHHQRSRSPVYDSISQSPRRRSRSSRRSRSPRMSLSPIANAYYQKNRSISPQMSSYNRSLNELDIKGKGDGQPFSNDWKNFESNSPQIGPSTSELQAQLERRITEAMEKNSILMSRSNVEHHESHIPSLDFTYEKMQLPPSQVAPYRGPNMPIGMMQNEFPPLPPFSNNNAPLYHPSIPPPLLPPVSVSYPGMLMPNNEFVKQKMSDGFYVTISGLDPLWNFREVQMILKGIYAPQSNIRWEVDDMGYNTGTAFIKLTNRDDFESILRKATYSFNGRRITLSECPEFLSRTYFHDSFEYRDDHFMQQKQSLCYILKGLPFACTYDDIVSFYEGLEVADIVIFHGKDGKATGTGYVSFTNLNDFEAAFSRNGKKIGHRYIEMLPSTEKEMAEAKRVHPSTNPFTPYGKHLSERKLPVSRRSLCAIITGLPFHTSIKKINDLFSKSGFKPDAFHITLNKKKQCDGRAFIEFNNFRDFDNVLKLHGNSFLDNIICVKQILYDEMINILDTQKAKHHFDTPAPVTPELNVPDKVPYLWEPPDDIEEQERTFINRPRMKDSFPYSKNNYNKKLQKNFKPPMNHNLGGKTRFPSNEIPPNRNFNSYVKPQSFLLHSDSKPKPFNINKKNSTKDTAREPIKFNVNKQLIINTQIAETFDSAKNSEEKFKLSKLSPEKETLQGSRHKDFKIASSKNKDTDFKVRSPERVQRDAYKERRDLHGDKYFKSKSKNDSFSRSRNERESTRIYERREDLHHRSPLRHNSSPTHFDKDEMFRDSSRECVVQISNVSTSVGTPDLLEFLRDYAYFEETISRRYTGEDEPTGDVRVTFLNREEAELAIRALNGRHLKDIRVNMFIT